MNLRKIVFSFALLAVGVIVMSVVQPIGKYVVVRSKYGKRIKVMVGSTLSPRDRIADALIQRAVKKASKQHILSGRPVSRYDVKRKSVYLEYPDGTVKYQAQA